MEFGDCENYEWNEGELAQLSDNVRSYRTSISDLIPATKYSLCGFDSMHVWDNLNKGDVVMICKTFTDVSINHICIVLHGKHLYPISVLWLEPVSKRKKIKQNEF